MQLLELYCGIGGCAAAIEGRAEIVAAVDQNRRALDVYSRNFAHRTLPVTVESLPGEWFARAEVWWLSPPCQPYTVRGRQRDLADPRAASLPVVWQRIAAYRPRYVALENVPPFAQSQARAQMCELLTQLGYEVRETLLCPTQFGWPNRRQRYYLVAGRDRMLPWPEVCSTRAPSIPASIPAVTLHDLLDDAGADAQRELRVSSELLARFAGESLHIVQADDPAAITRCFTSAYGRSHARSGSYLRTANGTRHFSPREILRLLGFPPAFQLPKEMSLRQAWPLVGNSLSIPAVRCVLTCIPW